MFAVPSGIDQTNDTEKPADAADTKKNAAPKQVRRQTAEPLIKRRFQLEYAGSVGPLTPKSKVRVWLPIPSDSIAQDVRILDIDLPEPHSIQRESKYGNQMFYFETVMPEADSSENNELAFRVRYAIDRQELRTQEGVVEKEITSELQKLFLEPNRMVPVGGEPALLAAAWPQPNDSMGRARAIYDGVLDHMQYDKIPGFGRGDARWACQSGYGNCTDYHSLFISIARKRSLPAKFEIGLPISQKNRDGEIGGYHCWASFYVEELGWVPIDISEADKHPELREYYFGNLTADRVSFSVGRDLNLVPQQEGEPLNYFIYPYVEVDGIACEKDAIKTRFVFKDMLAG